MEKKNNKIKAQYSYAVQQKPYLCGIVTNGFGCVEGFQFGVYNKGKLNSLTAEHQHADLQG